MAENDINKNIINNISHSCKYNSTKKIEEQKWMQISAELEKLNYFDEALIALNNALSSNEDNIIILLKKGNLLEKMNKLTLAVEIYNKILLIDKKNEISYYKIGYLYYKEKKYDLSMSYFLKCISLYPKNIYALMGIASIYFYIKKDYLKAINIYDKVLNIDLKYEDALFGKAKSFFELGKYNSSINIYKHLIKVNSKNSIYQFN